MPTTLPFADPRLTPTDPPRLLPAYVRDVAACFPGEGLDAAALGIALPDDVRRSVAKRQAEYVAGRACARAAVRALDPRAEGSIGQDGRAPRWPAGLVGSITHTAGFAWAAVASRADARGIGIDAEVVASPDATAAIRALAAPGDDPPPRELDERVHYTLVFSAKESVFKCLYPRVGKMFWYEDAAVGFSRARRAFHARLRVDLDDELRAGTVVEGTYLVADGRVYTAALLPARR